MDFRFLHQEWERRFLIQLYREYDDLVQVRKINLRRALIELVDSSSYWGLWDRSTRSIRLSRHLIRSHSWFVIVSILKHEMAHQMVDEVPGYFSFASFEGHEPHGPNFKKACQILGVPSWFAKSAVDLQSCSLDWRQEKKQDASERMLDKVRKLLNLAQSSNEHEAFLAMTRVREIYAKHNLHFIETQEQLGHESKFAEFVHLDLHLKTKNIDLSIKKILGILRAHFFVQVIINHRYDVWNDQEKRVVEVIGTRENVLMAEYVFYYLQQQLDELVRQAENKAGRRFSRLEKKSYKFGLLEGFSEKLARCPKVETHEVASEKALVHYKGLSGLEDYLQKIYPNLTARSGSRSTFDRTTFSEGQSAGRKIILSQPIGGTVVQSGKQLSGRFS